MNPFEDIRAPLFSAFQSAANLVSLTIQTDNIIFDTPKKAPYAAFHFIPNDTTAATLGDDGQNETDGIIQIDLNYIPNTGEYDQGVLIGLLNNAFKIGKKFTANGVDTVIKSVKCSGGSKVNNYWVIYYTVMWYSFSNR